MTSLFTGIHVLLIEILKHLVVIILGTIIDLSRKKLGKGIDLFRSELATFWHSYTELNNEITEAHWVLEEWHS